MKIRVRGRFYKTKRCRNHFIGMIGKSWKKFDAMLFRFPFSSQWGGVWMPFCPRMDVLFIEKNKVIHKENAVPITLNPKTWKIYRCPKKYDSMIEIRPDNSIKVGDVVEWK